MTGLSGVDRDRLDPYLLIAETIGYVDQAGPKRRPDEAFLVSVEVKRAAYRPTGDGLGIRTAHAGSRFFTASATAAACARLLGDPEVVRVQFAEPLVPRRSSRPGSAVLDSPAPRHASALQKRRGDLLLGVIDNGCPFAHEELRRDGSTRVLRLWHQDGLSSLDGRGAAPAGFGYGSELTRADLDSLVKATTDASGSVNEDQCYRLAGYPQLRYRQCHGAHTLGLLVAGRRWNARLRGVAPSLTLAANAPSVASDIVFVQFPQELMDCVSVASLEHRAIDAFRYIYEVGKVHGYRHLVVSFGYESWVGPHDGSSWFETALDSLVQEAAESQIALDVFMVAGNSKARQAHVVLEGSAAPQVVHWSVPPGNEVPAFMEIWVPRDEDQLRIQVSPPGHPAHPPRALGWGESLAWPGAEHAQLCVAMHRSQVLGRDGHVVVLRIAPTHAFDAGDVAAPHGIWSICLAGMSGGRRDGIHLRLGRVEGDSNAPLRARQPHFVGRTEAEQEADRRFTLNGHACGRRVRVAGVSYGGDFPYASSPPQVVLGHAVPAQVLRGQSTPYSGAGPTSGERRRPDVSLPMEDGLLCSGVLSGGTRSGCVYRLQGTSTAVPAAAQGLADSRKPKKAGESGDPAMGERIDDPYAPCDR